MDEEDVGRDILDVVHFTEVSYVCTRSLRILTRRPIPSSYTRSTVVPRIPSGSSAITSVETAVKAMNGTCSATSSRGIKTASACVAQA
ncbi:hypothetical protein [Rhodococcus artemisiae]|uniref:Uncharacterized protein n=1 Tax=Rhodococcus artemisiae TaxID=714159 RepID=A0ABU7L5H5_9NOCA|nr:hypothetical protein [Rhodococcus artemisiae]MEE2056800.1 hypothetical protein [Rhodococcus artemisiae]